MKRRIALGLTLALLTVLLGGCWSRKELNDLSIVAGIGIDKIEDQFRVSVQIVNPGQVSKSGETGNESPVVTYHEEGKTVPEALRALIVKIPRQLYLAHLRLVVFGEDAAKEGIGEALDFLARNAKTRTDFYLVVAKNAAASEVLKVHTRLEPIPASNLNIMLDMSDRVWAATGKITLDMLLEDLGAAGSSVTLTGVRIEGSREAMGKASSRSSIEPPIQLKFDGMAVFLKDKLIGWLDNDESKAMNYIQNDVKRTIGYVSCPGGGRVSMEVVNARSKIRTRVENGKPSFDVHLNIEQDIADVECEIDLSKESSLNELEERSRSKIDELLHRVIETSQHKLKSDMLGFGKQFQIDYPKEWHKVKDWHKLYSNVDIRTHVHVQIRRIGTIEQSVKREMKR